METDEELYAEAEALKAEIEATAIAELEKRKRCPDDCPEYIYWPECGIDCVCPIAKEQP